ncbi:hypothetical protein [Mameliella sp.]|uniref:hypothetical protein n=1 Tax=Mameliella sp. TaxID=1924940 RepID=UPI003BA94AA7
MQTLGLRYLATSLALAATAGVAEPDVPKALRLAQGLDINSLLKDGPASSTPETNRPANPTDLLRGAPAPAPEAVEVPSPLPAARPVSAFPASALAGKWAGRGIGCNGLSLTFTARDDGFDGKGIWTDPVDGSAFTTRVTARAASERAGKALPGQPAAYLAYARQYAARITRTGASGQVADMLDDHPAIFLVAREPATGGLVLRFVAPLTPCIFVQADQ